MVLTLCLVVSVQSLADNDADSHWQKAEDMFDIAGGDEVIHAMLQQLELSLEQEVEIMRRTLTEEYFMGPEIDDPLAVYEESSKEILNQVFNIERYKELVVPLYMANFSEAELEQIIAFYKSPIGRTMTEKLPSIMLQSQALGAELGEEFARSMLPVQQELEKSIGLLQ
jgi:hypothetical protein